jgi:hypothetical protein
MGMEMEIGNEDGDGEWLMGNDQWLMDHAQLHFAIVFVIAIVSDSELKPET